MNNIEEKVAEVIEIICRTVVEEKILKDLLDAGPELLSLDEIFFRIRNQKTQKKLMNLLERASNPVREDILSALSKLYLSISRSELFEEIVNVVTRYEPSIAKSALNILAFYILHNGPNVDLAIRVYSSNVVIKMLLKHEGRNLLVDRISTLLDYIQDERLIDKILNVVKDYDNYLDNEILDLTCRLHSIGCQEYLDNLLRVFENKEVGKLFLMELLEAESLLGTELVGTFAKFSDLALNEGIEGLQKIKISSVLDLDPRDTNFARKLEEICCNMQLPCSRLTNGEIFYSLISLRNLNERYKQMFLTALDLVTGTYWENKKILEILEELGAWGIDVEKLKGDCWIYTTSGLELPSVDYLTLLDSLVISLVGSRDKAKYERAYKIISTIENEKKLRRAATYVRSSKKLRKKIIDMYKEGKKREVLEVLKETGHEELCDLVEIVEGAREGRLVGNYLVGFYGKYPTMMFTQRSTACCALLPDGKKKEAAIKYQLDPRVVTIGYSFVNEIADPIQSVRERGRLDGLAIMYVCNMAPFAENEVNTALIVDSVEGGHAFRNYLSKNFETIRRDIERIARKLGVKYIFYNANAVNKTYSIFVEKLANLRGVLWKRTAATFVIGDRKIPFSPDGKHFFESWLAPLWGFEGDGWAYPEGLTYPGYLVEIR